jgi:hypothetical protein
MGVEYNTCTIKYYNFRALEPTVNTMDLRPVECSWKWLCFPMRKENW